MSTSFTINYSSLVRQAMIGDGLSRKTINGRDGRIKRMFRWGTPDGFVPPGTYHAPTAVAGLKQNRTSARETVPVTTVTSLLQPLLLANTTYWVGLEAAPGDLIVWNQNTTGATGFSQTDGSGSWSASSQFQGVVEIDGTLPPVGFTSRANFTASEADVPEPRAFWMMALGLAVIARTGRRRAIPALPPPETTTR